MLAQWIVSFVGKKHQHRITNRQLAKELGCTEEYVSMVLNGRRTPKKAEVEFSAALDRLIAATEKAV